MAHSEKEFEELLGAESFVEIDELASAARNGIPQKRRADTWKYLLSVSQPDRSQELSVEREQLKVYMRHEKHNAEILHQVRAELQNSQHYTRQYHDIEREAQFISRENVKKIENVIVAFMNSNPDIQFHAGLVHMLCPFMACGLSNEADLFHCFGSLLRRLHLKFSNRGLHQYTARFLTLFRLLLPNLHEKLELEEVYSTEW